VIKQDRRSTTLDDSSTNTVAAENVTHLVTFSERSRSILGGWSTITAEQTMLTRGDGAEGDRT
jgi:hypothetical protein